MPYMDSIGIVIRSNSIPYESSRPNKVAGLWDNAPGKGFPTTKGQSLVDLDFLGTC